MDELGIRRLRLKRQGQRAWVLTLNGKQTGRQGFKRTAFEPCFRCGGRPPTYIPQGDGRAVAMCEPCIVEVLSAMYMSAEWSMNIGGKRNGQG